MNGTGIERAIPERIDLPETFVSCTAGAQHSFALTSMSIAIAISISISIAIATAIIFTTAQAVDHFTASV